MKRNEIEERFLDLLEERLPRDEAQELHRAIAADPELSRVFQSYVEITRLERRIAAEQPKLHPNLAAKILRAAEEQEVLAGFKGCLRRFAMFTSKGYAVGLAASLVVAVLAVRLIFETSESQYEIKSNTAQPQAAAAKPAPPVVVEPLAPAAEAADQLQEAVPPGHRAVTIPAESTAGIEGWVRPGSSVDIVATSREGGKLKSRIVTQDARVASVGGMIQDPAGKAKGNSAVTVIVQPAEVKKLEAARNKEQLRVVTRADSDAAAAVKERNAAQATGDLGYSQSEDLGSTIPLDQKVGAVRLQDRYGSESKKIVVQRSGAVGIIMAPSPDYFRPYHYVPAPADAESYFSYTENERILTAVEAKSTFSLDVDTAGYANARRFLAAGSFPPPDSIRVEEFINYFDYDYPTQAERPFTVNYEIAPSPLEPDRYLLKLGIKARSADAERQGGWNLVFLVDTSGSMEEPNKLPLVKRALVLLAQQMRPEDRLAIVTYAGDARVALDSSTGAERQKIIAAIESLQAGGSTNGSGGISLAYSIAAGKKRLPGVNRVVLATDGDFNVGLTSHAELIKLIEEQRRSGITLTALGFGNGNLKDSTLEQLADRGNGNYYYIDSFKEARKVLETDLTGTMEVVAKDVKLQIEFNPDRVYAYRLIGYDNRRLSKEDFVNDQVDAGEVGAGHTVTALYELVLNESAYAKLLQDEYRYRAKPEGLRTAVPQEISDELGFLKIRYKEPAGENSQELRFPISSRDIKNNSAAAGNDFKFAAAVAYFGQLLRQSKFAGHYTFRQIAELAQAAKGPDRLGYRQELVELVRNAAALRER